MASIGPGTIRSPRYVGDVEIPFLHLDTGITTCRVSVDEFTEEYMDCKKVAFINPGDCKTFRYGGVPAIVNQGEGDYVVIISADTKEGYCKTIHIGSICYDENEEIDPAFTCYIETVGVGPPFFLITGNDHSIDKILSQTIISKLTRRFGERIIGGEIDKCRVSSGDGTTFLIKMASLQWFYCETRKRATLSCMPD